MENKQNTFDLHTVLMSAYIPIDIKPSIGKDWTLNGVNNSNYEIINDSYDDSPTNANIINGYHSYIYADGLIDTNAETPNQQITNVSKHLSKKDASQICLDYKLFGAYAVQIIWNAAVKPEDKKPILIKYFKVFKLGLNLNDEMEVDGYWYSFDWQNHGKYIPKFYPKYDGKYKGHDVELLVIQRPSNKDFFSQPDWISGLRYAQNEGNLQNWSFHHIKNGFQGTKLITIPGGIPPTEEAKRKYISQIQGGLQGSDKANSWWVVFVDKPENAPIITDIPIVELNQQYVHFGQEAKEQLISAHGASVILFANTKDGNSLSNNADEIEMATAMQYRKNINGLREGILDGLREVFIDIDPAIQLEFKDFPSFGGDKREDVTMTENNDKQIITE